MSSSQGRIVVTGAAKRLGKAIAVELAKNGWPLLLHYHTSLDEIVETKTLCEKVLKERQCRSSVELIQSDFSSGESLKNFLRCIRELYGSDLFGVINNVGNFIAKKAHEVTLEDAQSLYMTNFHAPCLIMREISEILVQRGNGGRIINIGSAGLVRNGADTYAPLYSSTKLALLHMTKSYAKELAGQHISVNMVSPGKLCNSVDIDNDRHQIPFGRAGSPDEVAHLISFLMMNESCYITGQNIEISGGFCL